MSLKFSKYKRLENISSFYSLNSLLWSSICTKHKVKKRKILQRVKDYERNLAFLIIDILTSKPQQFQGFPNFFFPSLNRQDFVTFNLAGAFNLNTVETSAVSYQKRSNYDVEVDFGVTWCFPPTKNFSINNYQITLIFEVYKQEKTT